MILFVILFVQLGALLPSNEWVWSATYVTRLHRVSAREGICGLHAITAVSAASTTTQLYVSEAEAVFKNICGADGDFLTSMPTEEEEAVVAAVSASTVEVGEAATASFASEASSMAPKNEDSSMSFSSSSSV